MWEEEGDEEVACNEVDGECWKAAGSEGEIGAFGYGGGEMEG
jgi:hypothetical protein